jgi:hypothetical protein
VRTEEFVNYSGPTPPKTAKPFAIGPSSRRAVQQRTEMLRDRARGDA